MCHNEEKHQKQISEYAWTRHFVVENFRIELSHNKIFIFFSPQHLRHAHLFYYQFGLCTHQKQTVQRLIVTSHYLYAETDCVTNNKHEPLFVLFILTTIFVACLQATVLHSRMFDCL